MTESNKDLLATMEEIIDIRTAIAANRKKADGLTGPAYDYVICLLNELQQRLDQLESELAVVKEEIPQSLVAAAQIAAALTDVLRTEGGFVNYQGNLSPHRWFAPVIVGGKYLGVVPLYRGSFRLAPVELKDDFRVHRVKLDYAPLEVTGPGEHTRTTYFEHLTLMNRSIFSTEHKLKFIGVLDGSTGDMLYTPFD